MSVHAAAVAALSVVMFAASVDATYVPTVRLDECMSGKLRIEGKAAAIYIGCHIKNASQPNAAALATCPGKVGGNLTRGFAQLDARYPGICAGGNGDSSARDADTANYAKSVISSVGGGSGTCDRWKQRCVGRYTAAIMRCYAKAAGETGTVDNAPGGCTARAAVKLFDGATGCLDRAAAAGDCTVAGSQGATLKGSADSYIQDQVCRLDPTNPACVSGPCEAGPVVGRYTAYEITLPYSSASIRNPWRDVVVTVTFTSPNRSFDVGGFYYEPSTWKARIAPDQLGRWAWSATINGAPAPSGSFCVADTGEPGFVQPNPTNRFRMTYSNGQPYTALGIGNCVKDDNPNVPLDNFNAWTLDTGERDLDGYLKAYGREGAGFNLFRWSLDNCAFKMYHNDRFDAGEYIEREGKWGDEFVQKLRGAGIRVYLVLFGFPHSVPYREDPGNVAGMEAVKRYVRYMVDRYGAYVDFWELMNEATAADDWKTQVATAIRERDPYQHRISTSWEWQSPNLPVIEVISPHSYDDEGECDPTPDPGHPPCVQPSTFESDTIIQQRIQAQKQYGKLVIFGEQGNNAVGNWSPKSALRMRLRFWSSIFNEGTLIPWNISGSKYYTGFPSSLYIGPEERSYVRVLMDFAATIDADARIVPASASVGLRAYALAGARRAWAYVVNGTDQINPTIGGTLTLTSPVAGTATFRSAADGSVLGTACVVAGTNRLQLPAFTTDLVVSVLE